MALRERISDIVKHAVPDWLQTEFVKIYSGVKKDWNHGVSSAKKELELVKDVALIDYNSFRGKTLLVIILFSHHAFSFCVIQILDWNKDTLIFVHPLIIHAQCLFL